MKRTEICCYLGNQILRFPQVMCELVKAKLRLDSKWWCEPWKNGLNAIDQENVHSVTWVRKLLKFSNRKFCHLSLRLSRIGPISLRIFLWCFLDWDLGAGYLLSDLKILQQFRACQTLLYRQLTHQNLARIKIWVKNQKLAHGRSAVFI